MEAEWALWKMGYEYEHKRKNLRKGEKDEINLYLQLQEKQGETNVNT